MVKNRGDQGRIANGVRQEPPSTRWRATTRVERSAKFPLNLLPTAGSRAIILAKTLENIATSRVEMPKLSKVQKKVAKKRKDTSSLNENSRDAIKLRRAGARAEKLERLSNARNKAKNPHGRWTLSGR